MRRALILALVSLTLPMAAWADGIDLLNHFGSITISNAGITSKGSQLFQFNGVNAGHSLGSVSFATGALLSGSIQAGGIFSSVGSFFSVVGMGNSGQPKGTIFSGAFVGTMGLLGLGLVGIARLARRRSFLNTPTGRRNVAAVAVLRQKL